MTKLKRSFYTNTNTLEVAQSLLGKILFTNINGVVTSGIISETEAYLGIQDKASHAYGGRRTNRTNTLYLEGGHSYVYLCYGIHHLFNVVSNDAEEPHAILIRNILPHSGIKTMLKRRGLNSLNKFSSGPGTTTQALGINMVQNKISLLDDVIWIEDHHLQIKKENVQIGPRIGVDYAGADAKLPYRFLLLTNPVL